MPFRSMTVIKPLWWFNRAPSRYWADHRKLPKALRQCIDIDDGYVSDSARLLDAAFQALCKGIMTGDDHALDPPIEARSVPVRDEYRFVAKYFSRLWLCYLFVQRCLTLHNPLKQIGGLARALRVERRDPYARGAAHDRYGSAPIEGQPRVSVVIPTLNRYECLGDALRDLASQTYPPMDVFVVDQSEPFRPDFYESSAFAALDLRVIRQDQPALWMARNRAIRKSDAEWLLLYDDDSRVEPDWIEQHLRAAQHFHVDISSGVSISAVGDVVPRSYFNFCWSDQLDTGNVLIHRRVFQEIGLFDRQFERQRAGDGEFGLRAFLAGFENVSHPHAKRVHLKAPAGGLRQTGSWDAFRPTRLFAPRPVPSLLYLSRRYFGTRAAIRQLLISTPLSLVPYRFKASRPLKFVGYLLAFLLLPVVALQIIASGRAATRKIRAGPMIERL